MNVSDLAVPAKDIPVSMYVRLDHRCVSAEAKLRYKKVEVDGHPSATIQGRLVPVLRVWTCTFFQHWLNFYKKWAR